MFKLPVILPNFRKCTLRSDVYRYTEKQREQCKRAIKHTQSVEGIQIKKLDNANIKPQGYHIQISPNGIQIQHRDDSGKVYALRSLFLLFESSKQASVPCLDAEDYPEKTSRMFMLDIARNRIPSIATLYALIDLCCNLRINELQLYNEHGFAYSGHKIVWQNASPYTENDIRAIQDYADERCIELIPNQNSYGHMERWLKYQPYRHLAETEEGFVDPWGIERGEPSTLCPILPESLSFIDGLYEQYLPLFSSKRVNIGADEPWEHCMGKSRAEADRIGKAHVYLDYILKLQKLVEKYGKKMQMWADIVNEYPEIIAKLPENIILMEWGYEKDHPFAERCHNYKNLGRKFYTVAGTSSWNSIAGRISIAEENILNAIKYADDCVAITDWGDSGHLQQMPISFPPMLYFAALSWSGTDTIPSRADLKTWLSEHVLYEQASTDVLFTLSDIASGSLRAENTNGEAFILHNTNIPTVAIIPRLWSYYPDFFIDQDYGLELESLESIIATFPPDNSQGIWNTEIVWSAKMLRHAFNNLQLRRMLAKKNSSDKDTTTVVRKLLEDLQAQKEEFAELWLKHSRHGGLKDSLAVFEDLEHFYKQLANKEE